MLFILFGCFEGGGSGIGFEIARQLGLHGAKVIIMGRRERFLADACTLLKQEGVDCHYFSGDVRSFDSCSSCVQACVQRFGCLSILVNAAAGNFLANASELSSNAFKTVIDIDLIGCFHMARASFAELAKCETASIINISATLHYGATWFQAHASSAKAAIDSLTRSLALEWGSDGIRVTGIAPGPIKGTPGLTKLAPGAEEMVEDMIKEMIPLGRLGRTTDIAFLAVYLASSAGSFISGETIVVDGANWVCPSPPPIPKEMISELSRQVEGKSRSMQRASSKL